MITQKLMPLHNSKASVCSATFERKFSEGSSWKQCPVQDPGTGSLTSPKSTGGQPSKPPLPSYKPIPSPAPKSVLVPALAPQAAAQHPVLGIKRAADESRQGQSPQAKRPAIERTIATDDNGERRPAVQEIAAEAPQIDCKATKQVPVVGQQEQAKTTKVNFALPPCPILEAKCPMHITCTSCYLGGQ